MSVRDREDAVLARLHSLAPHLDGEPDPEFRAATRARLVAMAAVRSPAPEPISPLRRLLTEGSAAPARWRTRLTAGLAGAALAVTALATVVAVASDARPGDVLYDLKRGTEETQLVLAGDARGQTLLDLASTRLEEVRALVESGATALPAAGASATGETFLAAGADATLIEETLATMDAQTAEGAAWLTDRAVSTEDAGPLELLAGWAAGQSSELAALRDDVPAPATNDVDDSLRLLSDIATRATALDSSLDCPPGPATAGTDELGPVPAPCPSGESIVAVPATPGTDASASPQVPGAGSTPLPEPLPAPSAPSAPSVGSPVPGLPGGTESGDAPTSIVPPPPTGIVPTLPLPSISLVPTLPGTSSAVPAPASPSGGGPLPPLDVCVGPIAIGTC